MVPIPSSTTDLRECEHDTPHLALIAKAIFPDNLEFRISEMELVSLLRHEQRHALAQWPECTNNRADSKAEHLVSLWTSTVRVEQLTTTGYLIGLGV